MKQEGVLNPNFKHGMSEHPLYVTLTSMKTRCFNKNNKRYNRYGGRGITICKEWLDNPKTFLEWGLNNGWEQGLQIDRIDNDGNYEPGNCRFVTCAENCRNSSATKLNIEDVKQMRLVHRIGVFTLTELGRLFGVSYSQVWVIVNNKCWVDI